MRQPMTPSPRSGGEQRRPVLRTRLRDWDADKRHATLRLDVTEPAWAVFYGVGSRRFYAIAAWPVPHPLILDAGDTDELRALMREAELTHAARAQAPAGDASQS
jgi:hypothetical protein